MEDANGLQSWSPAGMSSETISSMSSKAPQAQMLDDPALCGIGLFFEKNEAGRIGVKDITLRGSAAREGTLETGDAITHVDGISCMRVAVGTGWPMNQLKSAILGAAGSNVKVTAHKASGRIVDVALIRGNPEYWQFYDMNQRLKKDLTVRDKEIEALKKKVRDTESSASREKEQIDGLNEQLANLEKLNSKMQMDIEREVDLRRRSENMVNGLNGEKKHLEDQIESLLKKVSEVTLSFKSGQSLAREMTEKARQAEQGRANEEKLRKLAEARETRAQSLLLEEIQRRKEAEAATTVAEAKAADQNDRAAREKEQAAQRAKLEGELVLLQSKLDLAEGKAENAKAYAVKLQEEAKNAMLQAADAEMKSKQAISDASFMKGKIAVLEGAVESAEQSKKDAHERESEALKNATKHDHNHRSAASQATNHEAIAASLKGQLEKLQADMTEQVALEKKASAELTAAKYELSSTKRSLNDLAGAKDLEARDYEEKLKSAKAAAQSLQEKISTLEDRIRQMEAEMASKERDQLAKLSQCNTAESALKNKVTQLEADLAGSKQEAERAKAGMAQLEQKLAKAFSETDSSAGQCRVLKAEMQALQLARQKMEEEQKKSYSDVERLKGDIMRLNQAMEAKDSTVADAMKRAGELNQQLVAQQALTRSKASEVEGLESKSLDLEAQLKEIAVLRKDKITLTGKAREADDLLEALKAENSRLTEKELKTRGELNGALTKVQDVMSEMTEAKLKLTNDYKLSERTMREELAQCVNEREGLQAELNRYYALPNPIGVGMGLDEHVEKLGTGGSVKSLKVSGMMPGMSADLSGVILVGDDVLEVDGVNCVGLTLEELREKIAGKRGTKVTFKMLRDLTDDGEQNGVEFMVTLKRGAWGPEHCVLSPEDRDMLDRGRWPAPGALTHDFNVAEIDRIKPPAPAPAP